MIIGNPIMAGVSGPYASIFVTGLSETDTVTAVHKKTVQVPNPEYVVPTGYTQLEYIESTGTQYIDVLNFEVASDFGFEIDFAAAYISGQGLFSFRDNDGGTWTRLYDVNNHRYVSRFDNEQYFTPTSDRQIVTLNGSSGDVAIDGVTQFTLSTISNTASGIMCIFGMENLGNHSGLSTGKIYSLKFKTGSDTTHSFIPAKRNSDSVIGLYDLVNNVFYTNAGTGAFTAGSEIPAYIEMTVDDKTLTGKWTQKPNPEFITLPDGYTQLEYIESTGTQYIDTGITITQNIGVYLDFVLNNDISSSNVGTFFGGRDSTNSCWICSYNRYQTGSFDFGTTHYEAFLTSGKRMQLELKEQTYTTSEGGNISLPTTSFNTNLSAYLFAANNNRTAHEHANFRLYSSKLYDGSTVVRNFIPCKRISDSVIGLYDLVNDVFYTNAGTGEFAAGAEVPQTIYGFLIKPIRDFGTWTVTATDGTKTATQDVLVDVITEYEIEMSYKLWLYKNGDECEDITGGWNATYTGTLRAYIRDGYLEISSANGNAGYGFINTNNLIDISSYSQICMEYTRPSAADTFQLNTYPDAAMSSKIAHVTPISSVSKQIFRSDLVAQEKTNRFVGLLADNTGYVYKIWLE